MEISNELIKYYLKNVLFINGTAYAGKSTMAKMLADKYGLFHCEENYDCVPDEVKTPEKNPNLCYFETMSSWQAFVNRTPHEYEKWINGNIQELVEYEISYLMTISQNQKVIVDTCIPVNVLKEIADYNQVAIMLSPQSMSVEKFFDREDEEKKFILEQINKSENPQKTMDNFKDCIAIINNQKVYDEFYNSGLYTMVRQNADMDTKTQTRNLLAKHFQLIMND